MVTSPSVAGITFQGKDPDERFQFYYRQHWIRLAHPTFRMLLLSGIFVTAIVLLAIGLEDSVTRRVIGSTLIILLILIQLEYLARLYRHFLFVVIVTDRKVHRIHKTLFTSDDHESIDLWVLQDIHATQRGPIQNLFGFGTITLDAQNTQMRLHFTPHIHRCYERMMHLREVARHVAAEQLLEEAAG